MSKGILPADYADFLSGVKQRIRQARTTAVRAVNRELILLYWDLGRAIVEKQQTARWGDAVVERLAADLRAEFPDMRGFSGRNLRDMKRFYLAYRDEAIWRQAVAKLGGSDDPTRNLRQPVADLGEGEIWPQAVAKLEGGNLDQFLPRLVAEIPWGQHLLILNKLTDPAARLYYLRATAQFGWSRKVLQNQIKAGAYERAVTEKKTHNFPLALPEHFAEQADEMMKSRYNLEFLGIGGAIKERDLENRLIEHLQQFILELGYGFFPKSKTNPIGVAEYHLQPRLPAEFKGKLPTARQLSDAVRRALPASKETR